MVMGVDSRSKGRGFESQRRILDGHFFTLICCKNCIVCLKRPKINKKRPGLAQFLKNNGIIVFGNAMQPSFYQRSQNIHSLVLFSLRFSDIRSK